MVNGVDKETQVDFVEGSDSSNFSGSKIRSLDECIRISLQVDGISALTNDEILMLIENDRKKCRPLVQSLKNETRAVEIRRLLLQRQMAAANAKSLAALPFTNYDYAKVTGACCENVIGYMPIPVGYVGPLRVNGKEYFVPLATTEGTLVASTNRGCKAVSADPKGVSVVVSDNGMTRAPVLRFPDIADACNFKKWIEDSENFETVKKYFDSTSRYARLIDIRCAQAGCLVYPRFRATTGDAMGMNMLTKGAECALKKLKELHHLEMEVVSLSGNFCTDKKSAAVNWVEGRGKHVICSATLSRTTVKEVLKTTVDKLIDLNQCKSLIGSALAGSLGGFNAHSANIVSAIFLATGQDVAQNVNSSNCITLLQKTVAEDLLITCTLASLELGTIGGGTVLPPQQACLEMLGCAGGHPTNPGANAEQLARLVGACVLAGEISLLAALCSGDLVNSHMTHNRSMVNILSAAAASEDSSSAKDNENGLLRSLRQFRVSEKSLATNKDVSSCSKVIT